MIHAKLVRKSWTACGYPNEDKITGANEGAVVAYTGEQVESLVDRLYRGNGPDGDEHGAEIPSDFMERHVLARICISPTMMSAVVLKSWMVMKRWMN